MSSTTFDGPMAPIAIVGISCRLPGGANSPDELWELLERAGEAWSPVPADRFNEAAFYHPNGDDPNGTNNHRGGHFISQDLSDFDHSFFRLSPQQAAAMDPQQRLLLEMSYEAIENAGMTLELCAGSNTAVYIAGFTTDFERNLYRDPLNLPVYYLTGVETAILSNRISHVFDLHGPSMTIDTGCSGGMVALHQACVSLRNGESDAAIVGAANLTLGPDHHIGMSTLHLISGSGRSYPFDERGDGYGRGEGCVTFMIKRLDDALKDGNPVQAVIRNTAVNQDGHTASSITYPNGLAQEQLIRDTYHRAGLSPSEVLYVEAHGTGTVAGDFEELTAIANVFTSPTSDRGHAPLYVGSIKGNIGHTENTSGLASLIKASLILNRLQIPPTVGLSKFKPGLPLEQIDIPTKLLSWPQLTGVKAPPRISINSFGFGGTNAHAILERAPSQSTAGTALATSTTVAPCPRLFLFSANSQRSLETMISAYHGWTQRSGDWKLSDLSNTLCHHRSKLPWRYSCVASDQESLQRRLSEAMSKPQVSQARKQHSLVFVFTGQGAQWMGMGRELMISSRTFQESIRASRNNLFELGATWDLEVELLRSPKEPSMLHNAELAQPATTAVQIALVDLLRGLGVLCGPCAVLGHSSGEIAAAYAAGFLTAQDALGIAYHRGFMAGATKTHGLPRGAMLSVGLGESEALTFTKKLSKGIATIACVNSPKSVTISGDAEAIDEISANLAAQNTEGRVIFQRRLLVDTAYHSYHMQTVAELYRQRLKKMGLENPACPSVSDITFFSSVSGISQSSGFGVEYWTTNLVAPVRFYDAVRTVATESCTSQKISFIEVGPHSALAGPIRQCLATLQGSSFAADYYSVLQRNSDAVTTTLTLAGQLIDIGVEVDLKKLSELSSIPDTASVLSNLPPYTWDHSQKHMFEARISKEYRTRRDPYHDLLGVRAVDATSLEPRWRHMIGVNTLPWLEHHVIDSQVVFPGSGYLCMAIEAVRQVQREKHPGRSLATIVLRNVSFLRALVVPGQPQRTEMQLSLSPEPDRALGFTFRVSALTDGDWREHCSGKIEGTLAQGDAEGEALDALALSYEAHAAQTRPSLGDQVFGPEDLYAEFAENGNWYGPTFAGVRQLILQTDVSVATVEVPDVAALMPAQYQQPHLIHPTTLDIILHTGLPLASRCMGKGSIMPIHIKELLLSATASTPTEPGSQLIVSNVLKSSRFRTAYTDLSATTSGRQVLTASGIELRSLSPQPSLIDMGKDAAGICYEMDWQPDLDFLRSVDLPIGPNFGDIARYIKFKKGGLRILALGADRNDLSPAFFNALTMHDINSIEYDFASPTSESPRNIPKQMAGYPIRYRVVSLEANLLEQDLEADYYDAVLIKTTSLLDQASILVNPTGMVILQLKNPEDDSWHAALQGTSLDTQLSFLDSRDQSVIIVARPLRAEVMTKVLANVQIVTRSGLQSRVPYVATLQNKLLACGIDASWTTIQSLNVDLKSVFPAADPDITCVVIMEDEEQPIISDPQCFEALISLLKQPVRIVWISPDEPLPMHQITGVARTAHSENEDLRLTLVHVASKLLSSKDIEVSHRLCDIVVRTFSSPGPHEEREYQVNEDGTVLIPRLQHSMSFNNAVCNDSGDRHEIQQIPFTDSSRILALFRDDEMTLARGWSSFKELPEQSSVLADKEVIIDVRAFELSRLAQKSTHWAYAGIITAVGAAVTSFSPGDRVLSVGPVSGTNRIRIPSTCAGRLPSGISFTQGAGILFDAMAASYALYNQARLSSQSSILVHDALSPVGRAAVAIARSIGARVSVTAISLLEARSVAVELDISDDHILLLQQGRTPRPITIGQVDVILQAGLSEIPEQALLQLQSFGTVVIAINSLSLVERTETMGLSKILRNQAVFFCDLAELLHDRPGVISELVQQATGVLGFVSMRGLDLCIRPITHAPHALRLVETEVCDRIVLDTDSQSIVPVLAQPNTNNGWQTDASYLTTGGLGDLGQRLLLLMARRGAKHLVTLSRRLVDEEERGHLQRQLREFSPGCNLYCISCDITSTASIQRAAVTLTQMGLPPVRGIIQSAAILQDRTLDSMTYEDFLLASRVKIDGTLSLESIFETPHLEFFLMLSSAVNIVGASGQANYNAGNSVQDALARTRRMQGRNCRYTSLSIGWIEDAVHTANDEARLNGLRRSGLKAISHDELSRFLDFALGAERDFSRPAQAIIGFDAVSLSNATARNGNISSAMFCHIRNPSSTTASSRDTPHSAADGVISFSEAMATDKLDVATDLVLAGIKGHLARLLSAATDLIVASTSILSLGVDSLVSIELRNWIVRQFEAPMQSSEILVDQTIQALAEKVVSRSQVASRNTSSQDSAASVSQPTPMSSLSTTHSLSIEEQTELRNSSFELPNLPDPPLESTLALFEDSRRAIDPADEQFLTNKAVNQFAQEWGPILRRRLASLTRQDDLVARAYENRIYLSRREPLQEFSQFSVGHSLRAPRHSQATRAAILTVAALRFARKLSKGELGPETLHGVPVNSEARSWMFHAIRRPGHDLDTMERCQPNQTVAVLRRGHVFKLEVPGPDEDIVTAAVYASYKVIISHSEEMQPSVSTLTSDYRQSWAELRSKLERHPVNTQAIEEMDNCAFVVCLDDESPSTAGERHTQFLLNGHERPFYNRWQDKPIQLAITANGLSAGIFEHTKLDGMDVRSFTSHLTGSLFSLKDIDIETEPYPTRELIWRIDEAIIQRINEIQLRGARYGPLDHRYVYGESLGLRALNKQRAPPHATVHLTVLLAIYLVDGTVRPAWEIASLARFSRGRIDWVQTVSVPVRAFIEAAAKLVTEKSFDDETKTHLKTLFSAATGEYLRLMSTAANGLGYVSRMYALLAILQESDDSGDSHREQNFPELFRSYAWNATRRGGSGQDLKIGFMPSEGDDKDEWDEGGFLMEGERGIYVHCRIQDQRAKFAVSARPEYAAQVCEALGKATAIVHALLL